MKNETKNKEDKKSFVNINQILVGTFLLIVGIIIGITISLSDTFALETATASDLTSGTSTSSNATSSNATSSNATSSNATASNATSSNATASNATSSNAQNSDNVMYLNSISLSETKVKAGDKVYVILSTSGACNSAISITFTDKNNNNFSVSVENINANPYFIVPNYVVSGNYQISYVFLVGTNSDNTTFTKKYGTSNVDNDVTSYDFNVALEVTGNDNNKVELKSLSLIENSAQVGDKVSLSLSTSDSLTSLKLIFKSSNGNQFTSYVNDLGSNPYFIIPSTAKLDNYYLYQATLVTSTSSNVYTNGGNYNFNVNLEVKDTEEDIYVYNNEEITNDIIKDIYNGDSDLEVTINADNNPVISGEIFNAIKGTSKKLIINYKNNQLVFCGNDISDVKSINVSISIDVVEKNEDIEELIGDGIVVNFASNGNLPGEALVKIKITEEIKNTLGDNGIYVYYYDEEEKGFNVIAKEVNPNDGYYEFTISHNSKYVLTKSEVDDKLILEEETNVVDFQQSNLYYLLWICASILLILVVIAIIIIIRKRSNKK
jgi:hypothetical protein